MISSLYLFAFLYLLISMEKEEIFNKKNFIFIGIILGFSLSSFSPSGTFNSLSTPFKSRHTPFKVMLLPPSRSCSQIWAVSPLCEVTRFLTSLWSPLNVPHCLYSPGDGGRSPTLHEREFGIRCTSVNSVLWWQACYYKSLISSGNEVEFPYGPDAPYAILAQEYGASFAILR